MTRKLRLLIACLLTTLTTVARSPAQDSAKSPAAPAAGGSVSAADAAEPSKGKGIVEGILRYKSDPKRPWIFSRYYLQSAKDGPLAETVVALEGASQPASIPRHASQRWIMDQVDYHFVPETLAIRAGDEVRISNSDDALHNVMTNDGGSPFNVNVVKGREFTHVFDRAGGLKSPVRLGCVFHGGMRAWIYVFDHPWFKVTERDGRFRFEAAPAGEYTLGVIHPAGKLRSNRQIQVKSNETTFVEVLLSPDDQADVKAQNN